MSLYHVQRLRIADVISGCLCNVCGEGGIVVCEKCQDVPLTRKLRPSHVLLSICQYENHFTGAVSLTRFSFDVSIVTCVCVCVFPSCIHQEPLSCVRLVIWTEMVQSLGRRDQKPMTRRNKCSWNRTPLEKLTFTQLVKCPAFCGTRWFITMFTTVHHWSLSWARWIQSTPSHPIS
jgi:hypothetical protein